MLSILAEAASTTETKTEDAKTRHVADVAQFKGETMNEDQTPSHASTPADIVHYYDSHLNLTLRELSAMTGRTIASLKKIILQDEVNNARGKP
jgi:hypothetical protein